MSSEAHDVAIVGGGIVGLATARAIVVASRARAVVVEAESRVASHQTGHNSGVIHSGLYYRPGSSKARTCTAGREALYRFCEEHGVPHRRCGKVVVAADAADARRLDELERRGRANGLTGLERLDAARLREFEPHAAGVAALRVPQTGIVDFAQVAHALAADLQERGAALLTGARVSRVESHAEAFALHTPAGEVVARNLVNCSGLESDRLARRCGLRPPLRIVPFRGEYYRLQEARSHLVRALIYPVPDPRFPFLGVHLTRSIHGGVEVGPNAVLALARAGYRRTSFSARDVFDMLSYPGFWRLAARYWRIALGELSRSRSRSAFAAAARRLVPELRAEDLVRHGAGVRAQAVTRDGTLLDDFHILEAQRMLHVLNAPSPAATASLSIGESLARRAVERFGLAPRRA